MRADFIAGVVLALIAGSARAEPAQVAGQPVLRAAPGQAPAPSAARITASRGSARPHQAIDLLWIGAVRPSRRPLRDLLRMRFFNVINNNSPHAEERSAGARLEACRMAGSGVERRPAIGWG